MTTVNNTALSIGAVGACFFSYIAGLKLTGENNYEEFLFDSELGLDISAYSTDDYIIESPKTAVANEILPSKIESLVNVNKDNSSNEIRINTTDSFGKNDNHVVKQPYKESNNVVEHNVKRGDSFISIARKAGVEADDLTNLLYRSGISQSTFSLKNNQKIDFEFTSNSLKSISIYDDSITYVKITTTEKGTYTKTKVKRHLTS